MELYIEIAGERRGPFTKGQIVDLRDKGTVTDASLAWIKGAPAWAPLATIPGVLLPDDMPPLPGSLSGIPPLPPQRLPGLLVWGTAVTAVVSPLACYSMKSTATDATQAALAASAGASNLQELLAAGGNIDPNIAAAIGLAMIVVVASNIAGIAFAGWGIRRCGWKNPWITIAAGIQAIVGLILLIGFLN